MLPVQEIVISPDEGVIGTGLQFTFPKGMGQNQLGGIKAVVGVVERADVAIAFGLAFFFSLLVIITFSVYQVGVEDNQFWNLNLLVVLKFMWSCFMLP